MNVEFEIRRFTKQFYSSALKTIRGTEFESQTVAQVEPSGLELTRAGRRFYLGYTAAPTGIAPVQALPTTAPQWAAWNPETPGGQTYYIESIGEYLTAGTPGVGGQLFGCLFQLPAVSSSNAGLATCNANPSSSRASKMLVKSAVAITLPVAPVWFPIGESTSPNVTAFASSAPYFDRNRSGRLCIPPQFGLGLSIVAPAGTTPLWAPFLEWVELDTSIEP